MIYVYVTETIDDELYYLVFTPKKKALGEKTVHRSRDGVYTVEAEGSSEVWALNQNLFLSHSPRCGAALSCGPGARLARQEGGGGRKKRLKNNEESKAGKQSNT